MKTNRSIPRWGGAMLTTLALGWQATAQAAPVAGGIYQLKAKHSGKCLDVSGVSTQNGAVVHQWACHTGNNQKWRFNKLANGNFALQAVHSNKCLDVKDYSMNNNAPLQQWDCGGANNQQWVVADNGDGTSRLLAGHSGKAADVYWGGTQDGAAIVQYPWSGNNNQRWILVPVDGTGSGGGSGGGTDGGSGGGSTGGGGSGGGSGGTTDSGPYNQQTAQIPGTVEAENYDYKGFRDTTVGNSGGAYRKDDVDLEASTQNGFNVGWTEVGEWLQYTVNVAKTGSYQMAALVASQSLGGQFQVFIDGNSTAVVNVPVTGGWQQWQWTQNTFNLSAGQHVLRIGVTKAGFNLNALKFSSQTGDGTTPPPPPPPPPVATVTPLYNASTTLEPNTQFDRGDALVTRFSDRPRTRHAREDQFQSYDHYIKFYFEHRSSNIEIVDYVAKGGDRIEMNVRTLWRLDDREAENRWWYLGRNTVAHYVGNGIMTYLGFDGIYHRYTKTDNVNRQFNREIRVGDRLEFEISQFSTSDIPRGQANYYGTTFLYIVGEGIVPWYTENAGEFVEGRADFQEDSRKIPESYWLGGKTTLHYQYTNEPNDHFMQMATNLGYNNGQKFLLGRRVHHSSVIDGMHDEDAANGSHPGMAGLAGTRYINERCTDCHERNGGAPVAPNGQLLDRWVFKVGDANGNPHPDLGRVLQPSGISEGGVSIAFWTESNGLRKPNYQFNGVTPPTFSARIAPRLVGLGLLEAIPESTILAKEDPNDANGDGISGRANRIPDPLNPSVTRLGRFGWKAGTTSVKHQTAAALNTDMGVRSSVMPNPDCGTNQNNCGNTSRMISNQHLDELVLYLSTLGVRPQRGIESGFVDQTINHGKQKFRDIGCTSCHTETVQTSAFHPLAEVRNQTIHPYTDLLLHDMGPGLADNLGEGSASGREWRTTPLWGLGLAACVTGGVTNPSGREGGEICTPHRAYLHDGRARTIEEAILWHGGEGEASKNAYQSMSSSDKQALLRFLEAL